MIVCKNLRCGYYYQGYCAKPFLIINEKGECKYFYEIRPRRLLNEHGLDIIDDREKEKPVIIDVQLKTTDSNEAVNSA